MNTKVSKRIVGDFMGVGSSYLKYDSNWNWLMEVVERIESLKSPYDGFSWSIEPFSVLINRNSVYIQVDAGKSDDILFPDMHCKTKIELVYNTCVEFIKWYNEQKKEHGTV